MAKKTKSQIFYLFIYLLYITLHPIYDFNCFFLLKKNKNKLQMTKKLLKTSFAFILTMKNNKSKQNFLFRINKVN